MLSQVLSAIQQLSLIMLVNHRSAMAVVAVARSNQLGRAIALPRI